MRIVVHLKEWLHWMPVPADVVVTPADISSKRVKPTLQSDAHGNPVYLMQVPHPSGEGVGDETVIMIAEEEVVHHFVAELAKRNPVLHAHRSAAIADYVAQHIAEHQFPRTGPIGFTVENDEPNAEYFESYLKIHVDCGNLTPEEGAQLRTAYMQPVTGKHHVTHLEKHFRVHKNRPSKDVVTP